MVSHDRPATRLATRLAFVVAGFGIACWAPLVPFAKQRLAVDDAMLGLLLFCIGFGSLVAMQFAGALSARYGSKPAIVAGGLGLAVILPFLAAVSTAPALAGALLGFGAALGSLDVAMNIHAVEVERAADRPLMSGFHALFSIGGFAGSTLMTFLLSAPLAPLPSTLFCAAIMLVLTLIAWPRLLNGAQGEKGPLLVMPRGIVLLIATRGRLSRRRCAAGMERAADHRHRPGVRGEGRRWLHAVRRRHDHGAFDRRCGDRPPRRSRDPVLERHPGGCRVRRPAHGPVAALAMAGFLLIGLGASNIVPVLFRKAGAQTVMPPALAVSAMTTAGYAGVLAGPAAMGFVSKAIGLHNAFWMLAALFCLVPLTARFVAGGSASDRSQRSAPASGKAVQPRG